jgi:hypothetical protein
MTWENLFAFGLGFLASWLWSHDTIIRAFWRGLTGQ